MDIPYWLTVNWPWIVLAAILFFAIISLKNKFVLKKMNSLFGWPPSP